jgi:hypothetical protein
MPTIGSVPAGLSRPLGREFDFPACACRGLDAEFHGFPFLLAEVLGKLEQAVELDAVDGNNPVALDEAGVGGGAVRADLADDGGAGGVDPHLAQSAALEPAGFFGFKSGFEDHRIGLAGPLDGVGDFLAAAEDDALGDRAEGSGEAIDGHAVDFGNLVAGEQTRLGGRAGRQHVSDFLGGDEIRGFADFPNDHCGGQGQQHRKQRTGESDDDLIQRTDRRQRVGVLFAAFEGLHRGHLRQRDKSAGGDPAEAVLHAVDFLFPDRLAEPDLETVDSQATPFRGPEVAEFMDEDDDVEHHHNDEDQNDDLNECGKTGHGWG